MEAALSWETGSGRTLHRHLRAVAPTWVGEAPAEPWREADAALRSIARRRAALDAEEAEWLLRARDAQVHLRLGLPTFIQYLENVLGYGPRAAQERIRVAESLANLPCMRAELASGGLAFSAVRELSRVALAETEAAWLEAAEGKNLRQVERLVVGKRPGDLPDAAADPELIQHLLRFEVSAETAALFREALRKIRQDTGTHLVDDEALAQMARAVLDGGGGQGEPGDAPYQVALAVCASCKKTEMQGGGEPVEVGPEVLERAMCDAVEIGRIDQGVPGRASRTIPPAIRRLVWHRDGGRCIVPGCRSTIHCEVHHIRFRSDGGGHDPANLGVLCGACHARVHAGTLVIRGNAPDELTFLHGDGRRFGEPPPGPSADQVFDDARSALANLGFSKVDARAAVESVRSAHVDAPPSLEDLIRATLKLLRRR